MNQGLFFCFWNFECYEGPYGDGFPQRWGVKGDFPSHGQHFENIPTSVGCLPFLQPPTNKPKNWLTHNESNLSFLGYAKQCYDQQIPKIKKNIKQAGN